MSKYSEEDIKVLSDLEHLRSKTSMYLGGTDNDAMHHAIKEVIDNALDEHMAGHCDTISLFFDSANNTVAIHDNGRGIPVETHKVTGISTLTTIFTKLHSGGKYVSSKQSGYATAIGTHGVGSKATVATSNWFCVWTHRDGIWWHQKFERGIAATSAPIKQNPLAKFNVKQGTLILLQPDPTIFKKGADKIKPEKITHWVKSLIYLCRGLKFSVKIDDGQIETFVSEHGLRDLLLQEILKDKYKEADLTMNHYESDSLEVAYTWIDEEDEDFRTFVNCSPTSEGGTHYNGARKAITDSLKEYVGNKSVFPDDLRYGLRLALHVRVETPEFQGQVKHKLLSPEAEKTVYDQLSTSLDTFFKKNTDVAKTIVERAARLRELYEQAQKAKKAVKNLTLLGKNSRGVLPGKLMSAPNCKPADRELYICEGDSASGSGKYARFEYQEILPLKGKPANAAKQDANLVLANEEIKNIITASNIHVLDQCDPKKARIGRIVLLPDADEDGAHIACLLLAFFAIFMRPLIDAGMLYYVDSPLFICNYKDIRYFGHSLQEVEQQLPPDGKKLRLADSTKVPIARLKGHGKANPDELRQYAFEPTTRKLWKISVTDAEVELLQQLMGTESQYRKILLGIVRKEEATEEDLAT